MGQKSSFIRCGLWLAILACLITAHVILKQNPSNIIAEKLYIPTYVGITDKTALELGIASHNSYVQRIRQELKEWEECAARTDDDLVEDLCHNPPVEVKRPNNSVLIANSHAQHRAEFFNSKVVPRIKEVEVYIDAAFFFFYAILAMFPLAVLVRQIRAEGLENARHNLKSIKKAAPIMPNIRALDIGRKLHAGHEIRQTEKDFATLKNLYDNGLITGEMFLKRKAALGSNEMFSKDGEASSPK